jgi:hypothetical protein
VKVLVSVCGVTFWFVTVDDVGTGSSECNKLELQTSICKNVGQNCLLTDVQTNSEPYMLFLFILFLRVYKRQRRISGWVDGWMDGWMDR